ncbi:MAG: DUF4184 family protein [Bacteroidota bacterium]
MPFTFSHPAMVLPLSFLPRRWYSLTGLIIGSLTPDFEYFLRMKIQSNFSHTISGLFWFDLPLGILLGFIFHNIVRDTLFDNLPGFINSRLVKFKQFDWNKYFKNNWIIATISVFIGASSHVFWDGFTHDQGYFVKTIPSLTNTVELFGRQIPNLKILQHVSTLVGGLMIVFAVLKLPPGKNVSGQANYKYWSILTGLTFIIISIRFLCGFDFKIVGHLIATSISALLISLILTPILIEQK